MSFVQYMSPNADELHAISTAIRQKLGETEVSINTAAYEGFAVTKESRILPVEEMTRLKDDLITGTNAYSMLFVAKPFDNERLRCVK